ncbi:MAG: hypothetical protein LBV34_05620 [Nocardiopsaceae bacterium]|jgi:sigma-E factor negative regulatory protein RseB|nr:hypothetical protein [Nocardiopsaceae bacterium]
MLWLYWRRSRLVILVAAAVLGLMAGLALLADSLGGTGTVRGHTTAVNRQGPQHPKVVSPSNNPQVRRGLSLLSAAAAACKLVSYTGVQIVAWTSTGASSSYLINVWHRSGEPELAATAGDGDDASRPPGVPDHAGAVGVLNISPAMLTLVRANYVVEYAGTASFIDRPARIVAVRRHDGTLAAKYWLDRQTGLPLRREMFDESGNRVSEGAFLDLTIGLSGVVPPTLTQAWETYVSLHQTPGSRPTAARIRALHADGWPVPRTLAGVLQLASVSRTATRSGTVLDASYSDGLSVVSLFIQRGELEGDMPGWHRFAVNGLPVYSTTRAGDLDEQGLAWSAGGFVYTVIADAPPQAISRIIAQLPHERETGFWDRVARGITRIGSWFDPFG